MPLFSRISPGTVIKIVKIGVHPSSHALSRHQIVLAARNLKIDYPPLSYIFIWNCKNAEANCINHSTENFDWLIHLEIKVFMIRLIS